MTALAVTAVVSTGFAYDYVCNNSQYNCNTNTQYNSDNYCLRGKGNIDLVYQPYELGPYAAGNTYIGFAPKAIEYFNRMNS